MEFGIGLLILFGVLFVILAKAHRNAQENAHEQSPKVKKANTPRKVKRDVFDASTAKTLEPGSVLEGRARILDGDSLIIQKTQVRLYGVDAPELNHPFGQKAKWALVALCKGQDIRAEVTEHDAYGRTVALCFLEDGRELSAEMVKTGLAIDWAKFSGGVYRKLEPDRVRKKLWLADARQKGRMDVWERFEARKGSK